jgi:nitroreductase
LYQNFLKLQDLYLSKKNIMLKTIQNRRSCRKFLNKDIEKEKVDQLIQAALWSPTSKNNRPWEFILIKDPERLNQISQCKPHGSAFLKQCNLAIIIIADPIKSDVWVEDCSVTASYIQLAAEELGLGSCWVQIRLRDYNETQSAGTYIKELLQVPGSYEVASIIGLGYKEKERRAYSENDLLMEKIHWKNYKQ